MSFLKNLTSLFKKQPAADAPTEELSLNYGKVEADEQGPADVAALDPVAFNKSKGNVEFGWKIEEGESTPPQGPEDVAALDPVAFNKSKGNVEYSWKVEEGESAPPQGPEDVAALDPVAFNKNEGKVEFEWKVEEGESAPPPEPAFGVEREMKESGEKGGTEDPGAQASESPPMEEMSLNYNKIQATPENDPGFTPDPPPDDTSSWNFERAWPSKVSGPSPKSDEGETSEVEHKIAPDASPEPSLSDDFVKFGKVVDGAAEEGHKVAPSDAVSQSQPPGGSTAEGSGVDTEPFLKWSPPEPGSDVSGVKSDAFQKVTPDDDTAFNKAEPDEAALLNKAAPVDPPPLQKVELGDFEGVKATSEAPSVPGEDVSAEKPEEGETASSDDLSLNFPKVEMPAQEAPSPPGEEEGIIIIEGMPADDEEPSTLVDLGETPSQETARLGDLGAELGEEDLPDIDADDLGGP